MPQANRAEWTSAHDPLRSEAVLAKSALVYRPVVMLMRWRGLFPFPEQRTVPMTPRRPSLLRSMQALRSEVLSSLLCIRAQDGRRSASLCDLALRLKRFCAFSVLFFEMFGKRWIVLISDQKTH
jgi:hypothetical protein